ncbi:hypothetical protein AiwAL_12745, partial [Acidiphilium sp. AL]|uniref:hypothetical protein n=1 Tax=Acidiphilium sp. AL TaxID=2871704 RepID=UPI0021CB1280
RPQTRQRRRKHRLIRQLARISLNPKHTEHDRVRTQMSIMCVKMRAYRQVVAPRAGAWIETI